MSLTEREDIRGKETQKTKENTKQTRKKKAPFVAANKTTALPTKSQLNQPDLSKTTKQATINPQ